jgi:serine/threonine protein kinase
MLVMHAHQRPRPPSRRGHADISPELEEIVMMCLDKNPNKRPQSAAELSERLSELAVEALWTPERMAGWWGEHSVMKEA